jgi:RND family efflux transporter MFP subunit
MLQGSDVLMMNRPFLRPRHGAGGSSELGAVVERPSVAPVRPESRQRFARLATAAAATVWAAALGLGGGLWPGPVQAQSAGPAFAAVPPAGRTPLANAALPPPEQRILVQAWADTETVISSPMVGLILQIPTRAGTRFEKGDLLIRYECVENEARAQIAQAELTAAAENLAAKIRLQSMNAASEIEVTTAAAQVGKAEAQLTLSQHQVRQCRVLAPFDGFVVRVMGKPHQTATVGQPMLEIITAGTPRLRVSADSRLFTRIRVGSNLLVTIDETGRSYAAQVSLVNARIDPVNQSFEMEARILGQSAGLLPGMSGSAVIVETEAEAAQRAGNAPTGAGAAGAAAGTSGATASGRGAAAAASTAPPPAGNRR